MVPGFSITASGLDELLSKRGFENISCGKFKGLTPGICKNFVSSYPSTGILIDLGD